MGAPCEKCGYEFGDVGENGAGCCWREVWGDTEYCIWHADADSKPVSDLKDDLTELAKPQRLDGAKLRNVDFGSGITFQGCVLAHSDLSGATLTNADLREVDFTDASLANADLRSARLEDAILDEADLSGATLDSAVLAGASLEGTLLQDSYSPQADFSDARFEFTDFRNAVLVGSGFRSVYMTGCDFGGAVLVGAEFTDSVLLDCEFTDVDAERTTFSHSDLEAANLTGANLHSADLRNANLRNGRLQSAILRDADLAKSDLQFADIRNADLDGADLRGADLSNADLRDARVSLGTRFEVTHGPDSSVEELKRTVSILLGIEELWWENGIRGAARRVRVRRKHIERRLALQSGKYPQYFGNAAYRAFSLYGESPWRIISSAILTVTIFAILYGLVGPEVGIADGSPMFSLLSEGGFNSNLLSGLVSNLAFSLSVFSAQFGFRGRSIELVVLTSLETLLGLFHVLMFALTVTDNGRVG